MFSGNICLFSFSSKLMFGAKSRKHLSWTLCFHTTNSSGSPWLLNALFVITDSSRGMDWPWCYCFVKETTLCAPTLNLWLTQLYILTHAHAFNIKRAASYDWNLGAWYLYHDAIHWSVWTSLVFLQYFEVSLCYGKLYMQIMILLSTLPRLIAT